MRSVCFDLVEKLPRRHLLKKTLKSTVLTGLPYFSKDYSPLSISQDLIPPTDFIPHDEFIFEKRHPELFRNGLFSIKQQLLENQLNCEYQGETWQGYCTFYSHAGCVGCHPLQIMANGEKFDENAMTIAFMKTALNEYVEVENLETGLSVVARVTDRGGFEKYGILADLSLGVARSIGLYQQLAAPIKISHLFCDSSPQV